MKFDRLFKKTSTGAIQFWDIEVLSLPTSTTVTTFIRTTYGQLGTDNPQTTSEVIKEGKSIGRSNETTAIEQAVSEAKAKHEKQRKKGYVDSLEAAQKGELDDLIEGGVVPMLAQSFSKHGHKIKFPCYVQPKLDGIRCIAIVENGKCTLWSRTRKPITSMPHIVNELEERFSGTSIVLDGELYNHKLKSNFEQIVSMVRQEEPDPNHAIVQYHIYDTINESNFENRTSMLRAYFGGSKEDLDSTCLRLVETELLAHESGVMDYFSRFVSKGYEGCMLRNADSLYVNKRSYDLQKVKEFDDAEFEITGIDEGRGKLVGHVGAFVCRTSDGKEFLAKMSGETGKLKEYFENHTLWEGKRLTVKYQGLTGTNGVPRFPVGIVIRNYE